MQTPGPRSCQNHVALEDLADSSQLSCWCPRKPGHVHAGFEDPGCGRCCGGLDLGAGRFSISFPS